MDQYMTKMATSFLEELQEIEKVSFAPLKFIGRGMSGLGKVLTKKAPLGGVGAQRAGGVLPHMKKIWGAGAQRAGRAGAGQAGQAWGGLKQLAGSRYGRMASAVAAPAAVGYGAHKMMS
jgi:hypothetical protein